MDFIKDRYKKTLCSISRLMSLSDSFAAFDNSRDKIQLIYFNDGNEKFSAQNMPEWFDSIINSRCL